MLDPESPAPHTITRRQAWVLAARPRTLPAAVGPVLVGTALAISAGAFDPLAALAALLAALLLQVASNFSNDLGDFERGTDTPERVGPLRVTTAGLLTASDVKRGIVVVLGVAAICGLYLIWVGGWPILAVGVLSMLAAVAYTYGPLPFGYYGLGDAATFIFFGFIAVLGTYYVQAVAAGSHAAPPIVWVAAIPMGALVTAILVVNNVRDADQDRAGGKRTLAVVLGRRGARIEFLVLLLLAYTVPIILWLGFDMRPWVLLPLLTLPLAIRHARAVWTILGTRLNKTLAGVAQLAVLYAIAFAVGIVL
jgi:1,4-dihydroxy-2-naphthoate octaprenyltransferase